MHEKQSLMARHIDTVGPIRGPPQDVAANECNADYPACRCSYLCKDHNGLWI
jgi:hypothetical protein